MLEQSNTFNHLITNGIAGLRSILIVPFHATSDNLLPSGVATYQSPFDSAGCGTTSPLAHLSQFNVVVAGQIMLCIRIRNIVLNSLITILMERMVR